MSAISFGVVLTPTNIGLMFVGIILGVLVMAIVYSGVLTALIALAIKFTIGLRIAEEDEVVTGEDRRLQLGHDGVVEAHDAGEPGGTGPQPRQALGIVDVGDQAAGAHVDTYRTRSAAAGAAARAARRAAAASLSRPSFSSRPACCTSRWADRMV